ncbi:MAG: STT3 domain-containing protein [Acidobacteriota bacterium]
MTTLSAPPSTGANRLLYRSTVMVALTYLLAFAIRLSNLDGVFTDFGIFPISTDSFYHLRRIYFAVGQDLQVPDVDYYVNFPQGARVNWPFGFDWLYALVARVSYTLFHGGGLPDEGWTTAVACWLTPLLGALTPCLGYIIAHRLGGAWAGVAAGLILAWLPSLWVVCAVGYVDHHVFESLCTGCYLWAVIRERPANWHGVMVGSTLAVGLVCATILPLLVGIQALVTLAGWLLHRAEPTVRQAYLCLSFWAWITFLIWLAPFVATRVAEPHGVNPALITSWLAGWLAAGATLMALGWAAANNAQSRSLRQYRWWFLMWVGLGVGILPRLELGEVWHFVQYGVQHIGTADPWLATIFESQPLLRSSFADITNNYTGFFWLLPLVWLAVVCDAWQKSLPSAVPYWILWLISLLTTGLALLQLKFSGLFAVPFAVVVALALVSLPDWLARWSQHQMRLWVILSAVLFAGMLSPTVSFTIGAPTYLVSPTGAFVDTEPTLRWLATHTPATSPRGDQARDYAILCDWTPGHWVIGVAGRPTVASPLGHTQPLRTGIRDGAAMLVLPPEAAFPLIEARRVRYILITPLLPKATAHNAAWDPETRTSAPWEDWNERMKAALYARLVAEEGIPRGDTALTQLRLVYESDFETDYPLFKQPHAAAKVFERVPGALIAGQTTPGARVQISTRIRTYFQREFDYLDELVADAEGHFVRRVPYAQQRAPLTTLAAVTPYRIVTPEGTFTAVATEADITRGNPLQLTQVMEKQVAKDIN